MTKTTNDNPGGSFKTRNLKSQTRTIVFLVAAMLIEGNFDTCSAFTVSPAQSSVRKIQQPEIYMPDNADAFYARGMQRRQNRDLQGAIDDFTKAIELDPKNIKAYFQRALSLSSNRGDYTNAIADYGKILELDPKYYGAYLNRGTLRKYTRDYEGALADFDAAIALEPENPAAYQNRGILLWERGNAQDAVRDLGRKIELAPEDYNGYLMRGFIYASQRRFPESYKDFDRAFELDPKLTIGRYTVPEVLDHYSDKGMQLAQSGDLDEALAEINKAFVLGRPATTGYSSPSDPYTKSRIMALGHRGLIRMMKGDEEEARKDLTECLKLDPLSRPWLKDQIQNIGLSFSLENIVPELTSAETAALVAEALGRDDIQTIERLGPDSFEPLLVVLNDPGSDKRPDAVIFLVRFHGPKAVQPLLSVLKDPDYSVRYYATIFLSILGDPKAVMNPLVSALNDPVDNVRSTAALFLEILKWQSATDRQQAAYLTAQHKFQEAAKLGSVSVMPLQIAVKDPYCGMRREAAMALAAVPWLPETDIERANYYVALQDWPEVATLGAAVIKPLLIANSVQSDNVQDFNREAWFRQTLLTFGSQEIFSKIWEAERRRSESVKAQRSISYRLLQDRLEALGPIAVPALIDEIQPPYSYLCLTAIRMLSRIPADARTVDPLLTVFAVSDPLLRVEAVRALEHQGDKRAAEPLIFALNDPDPKIRAAAAQALGSLKDGRAVEPLILALGDPDPSVQRAAASSLGDLEDPRAIEPLMEALNKTESLVREMVSFSLRRLTSKGSSDNLAASLGDGEARSRILAAEILARAGDARGIDAAMKELDNPDLEVRLIATRIVYSKQDPRLVEPLLLRLQDENPAIRGWAARGLGRQGDLRAFDPLIAALKDESDGVRRSAAEGLRLLGDRRAVEPLKSILKTESGRINSSVAVSLAYLLNNATSMEILAEAIRNPDGSDSGMSPLSALMDLGFQHKEPVIALLKDDNPSVRVTAVIALRSMPGADIVAPLIEALKDTDQSVVQLATTSLIGLDDPRAVEPLVGLLKDPNSPLYKPFPFSIQARTRQKENPSAFTGTTPSLSDLLRDTGHQELQAIVAWILGRLGDKQAIDALWSQLESSSSNKEGIALALVRLGDPRGILPLLETRKKAASENAITGVDSEPALAPLRRLYAWSEAKTLEAIVGIGTPAFEPLMNTLLDAEAAMRALAAKGLGQLGDQRAVAPLTEMLRDENDMVSEAAEEALIRLRTPE